MTTNSRCHTLFFEANDTDPNKMLGLMRQAWRPDIDAMDVFLQHMKQEQWLLEDGKIKKCGFDIDCGAGVQVFSGATHIHTSTQDLRAQSIQQAIAQACATMKQTSDGTLQSCPLRQMPRKPSYYDEHYVIDLWSCDEKKQFLMRMYDLLASKAPELKQSTMRLSMVDECICVIQHDGRMGFDVRPMLRFDVSIVLGKNGHYESGYAGTGGRHDMQAMMADRHAEGAVAEAIRLARLGFEAKEAPAGQKPIVLGPGFTGVLLHEAIGHGLEGDFIRKKSSCFTDLLGHRVASKQCHIVDNGTCPSARGSLNIDDEGTPTQCTDLIVEGRVEGFMFDRMNARLMHTESTGNGRRESYASPVMPRMTNTYMRPGQYSQQEMIAHIEDGILALQFGGGQVDIVSGQFVFSATECYEIKGGQVGQPLKGITLCGTGFETLQGIEMVGDDLKLDTGIGICGKSGQSVPVCVGQPSMMIKHIGVGGTRL